MDSLFCVENSKFASLCIFIYILRVSIILFLIQESLRGLEREAFSLLEETLNLFLTQESLRGLEREVFLSLGETSHLGGEDNFGLGWSHMRCLSIRAQMVNA